MLRGISSMATRKILGAIGGAAAFESVGGVDAARRVRAGEAFDLVALALDAMKKLETEGHVLAGSVAGFVLSPMALCVRAGAPRPAIDSEAAIKAALLGARSIGYSTGPSGAHLVAVLKSWGLDPAAEPARFVEAKPGIPVAASVASGAAEIGVQQLSELLGEPGIDIVGLVPAPVQSVTTFAMGIGARSTQVDAARAYIDFANKAETSATKRELGMEPA